MTLPIANIFGVDQWIIVAIIVLLLFGGKKIPELMRGVGQGVGELKKGMEDGQRQVQEALKHDETTSNAVPHTPPATPVVPVAAVTSTTNSDPS